MRPVNPSAHVALGLAYWGRNEYPRALLEFRQAVEVGPRSAEAHNWLGGAVRVPGSVSVDCFGGAVIYGGVLVASTLVAHFAGVIRMLHGASMVTFLFGWAMLIGVGALIGFLAESDRGLYLP